MFEGVLIEDIFQDEQYRARGNLMEVDDPRIGKTVLPASVPRLSGTPARFLRAGGALGQDNAGVYEELLGVCGERLAALRQTGVV